jgi:hypothetical protein
VWPGGGRCRLTCRQAAVIMARCGLAWPCVCGHWLPVWLPAISLAVLMFECFLPEANSVSPAGDLIRLSQTRPATARPDAARGD